MQLQATRDANLDVELLIMDDESRGTPETEVYHYHDTTSHSICSLTHSISV
jgi:hypothetical protein